MSSFANFVSHTHPLLVHFPIALILIAATAEFARLWNDSAFFARATVWLLGLGVGFAALASGSGWLLATTVRRSDVQAMLGWHRWLGLAAAVLACLAWQVALRHAETTNPRWRWMRRAAIWGSAAFVAGAGHFGALLVWGRDWFSS